MKLGLAIRYSGAHLEVPVALVQRGGSWVTIGLARPRPWLRCVMLLAFLAAKTSRIKRHSIQLAARIASQRRHVGRDN